VDPRAGLDDLEQRKLLNLPGLELRPINLPARSQSLYRLHYPGSLFKYNHFVISSANVIYCQMLYVMHFCYKTSNKKNFESSLLIQKVPPFCSTY
jgi:hypothetical protein